MVQLVPQKQRFGCVAAVAAMIFGIDYEAGAQLLATDPAMFDNQGVGFFVLDSRLVEAGYAIARKYRTIQPGNAVRSEWPCQPWAQLHWCEVIDRRRAHAVVLLGDGTVLDPARSEPTSLSEYQNVNFIAALIKVPHMTIGES